MQTTYEALYREAKRMHVPRGWVAVSPHEEPRGVYYLHDGYIKAYDIAPDGTYHLVLLLGSGDVFPLQWALNTVDGAQLFYETVCSATVSLLSKVRFQQAIDADAALQRYTLQQLLSAHTHLQERLQNLALPTARSRLAARFLFLGHHFGRQRGGQLIIDVPTTYDDLAEAVNITRETANRAVRGFIEEGSVVHSRRHFIVTDVAALERAAALDT